MLFPDPLGYPHSADLGAEKLVKIARKSPGSDRRDPGRGSWSGSARRTLRPGSRHGPPRPGPAGGRCIRDAGRPAIPGAARKCAARRESRDSSRAHPETGDSWCDRRPRRPPSKLPTGWWLCSARIKRTCDIVHLCSGVTAVRPNVTERGRCTALRWAGDELPVGRPLSSRPGRSSSTTSTSRKKPAAFSGGTGLM